MAVINATTYQELNSIGRKVGLQIYYNASEDVRITPGLAHVSDGTRNNIITLGEEIIMSSYSFGNNSDTYPTSIINDDLWIYITVDIKGIFRLRASTDATTKNDETTRPLDPEYVWSGFNHLKQSYYYNNTERIIGSFLRASSATDWRIIQGYFPELDLIPTGSIIAQGVNNTVPPEGYLYCDGSAISRASWSRLFSEIGTTWGIGDGSTTFNLPNGQGVSLRGAGSQTINTRSKTGPNVGSVEEDQIQNITGSMSFVQMMSGYTGVAFGGSGSLTLSNGSTLADTTVQRTGGSLARHNMSFNASNTARAGTETRINAIGVNYYIRY